MDEALEWIRQHWNSDTLPNNQWVAVDQRGHLSSRMSVTGEVEIAPEMDIESVVFVFVSFDIWQ